MKPAFDIEALFAAAVAGAIIFLIVNHVGQTPITQSDSEAIGYGALIGAGVQISVRLIGIS